MPDETPTARNPLLGAAVGLERGRAAEVLQACFGH